MSSEKSDKYIAIPTNDDQEEHAQEPPAVPSERWYPGPSFKRFALWFLAIFLCFRAALIVSSIRNKFGHDLGYGPGYGPPRRPHPPRRRPHPSGCHAPFTYKGTSNFTFDPDEFGSFFLKVNGDTTRSRVIIKHVDSDDDTVKVYNKISYSNEELGESIKVDADLDGDQEEFHLIIDTPELERPRHPFPLPHRKCVKVETVIEFPTSLRAFTTLSLDLPNALVVGRALERLSLAYFKVKLTNGRVFSQNITAELTHISTVNGFIGGSFHVSDTLDVSTVNGAVKAKVHVDPEAEFVTVFARTVNGPIGVNVIGLTDNQAIDLQLRSVNGFIKGFVPATFEGDFNVASATGKAKVEGGDNVHFVKNSKNVKEGYKGTDGDSNAEIESVTRSVGLTFVD